jgi:L-fuconolactonase
MRTRGDAHIHLFAGGYQGGSVANRPVITPNEAVCYDSLARQHGIAVALVIGYAAEAWCANNNAFLAEQAGRYDWVRALAYADLKSLPTLSNLEHLRSQTFAGISVYIFGQDSDDLAGVSDEFWHWLQSHNWLVSLNSQAEALIAWQPVLERFPRLRLLVSHLGSPPAVAVPPPPQQAADAVSHVVQLARYPSVYVKLSGFYALTSVGYDYPHRAAWPYVERLVEAYSTDRLLWGSDFSPCLDFVAFPQTLDLLEQMTFLNELDLTKIYGENLLGLLGCQKARVSPGSPGT